MHNGSIADRYTLYTLIARVLHALYWKDNEDSWMVADSEIENESSEKKELFRMAA